MSLEDGLPVPHGNCQHEKYWDGFCDGCERTDCWGCELCVSKPCRVWHQCELGNRDVAEDVWRKREQKWLENQGLTLKGTDDVRQEGER